MGDCVRIPRRGEGARQVIIFATDPHIKDDSRLDFIRCWCRYVTGARPDTLILGGDFYDPWQAPWRDILALQAWAEVQTMIRNRDDAGLPTYYIRGNHDHDCPQIDGAEMVNKVIIDGWEFRHGWERDPVWKYAGISRIAFWIADHCPSLMLPIYKALYPTPAASLQVVSKSSFDALEVAEQWTLHTGGIHLLWRQHADSVGRRVCIGHTHCLWIDPLVCDGGSLSYGQWLEIDGEKVSVKTL